VNWDRSPEFDRFDGCRFCVHYRGLLQCTAYPERIPLDILSGEVDHMIPRPGQVGEIVFGPMDIEIWRHTGQRLPASPSGTRAAS
jgi:hypothetical protein